MRTVILLAKVDAAAGLEEIQTEIIKLGEKLTYLKLIFID